MLALRKMAIGLAAVVALGAGQRSAAFWFDPLSDLNGRVVKFMLAGDDAAAYPLAEQAFKIARERRGQVDRDVARALGNWSTLRYFRRSQFVQSIALEKEALAIFQRLSYAAGIATSLINLADTHRIIFRWPEAEAFYKQAIALHESGRVSDELGFAVALNGLGNLRGDQGRYEESQQLLQKSVELKRRARGGDDDVVAATMYDLATSYLQLNRYEESEALLKRAIAINRQRAEPTGPLTVGYNNRGLIAVGYNNLGNLYLDQERNVEAQKYFKDALRLREELKMSNFWIANSLSNLATSYMKEENYRDAEPLLNRAMHLPQGDVRPDNAALLTIKNNLGSLYLRTKRYKDGYDLLKTTLTQAETSLGPHHQSISTLLNNLIAAALALRLPEEGIQLVRRAMRFGWALPVHALPTLVSAREKTIITAPQALSDSFEIVQSAHASAAASAIHKLSIRFAAGTGELARAVKEDQDFSVEATRLDGALVGMLSRPASSLAPGEEADIRRQIASNKEKQLHIRALISNRFVDYAALSNPKSLTISETQDVLDEDEAMVVFYFDAVSYAWVITNTKADWLSLDISAGGIAAQVRRLRESLTFDKDEPFDANLAFKLYQETFAKIEHLVGEKRRLSVVANGALTSIPPQILVTRDPKDRTLRETSWLVRSRIITILPAVSSLKTLRSTGNSSARKPLIAFADPIFGKTSGKKKPALRSVPSMFRGGEVRGPVLRDVLPPLPSTAEEVTRIADILKVSRADIRLQAAASEANVKAAKLDDYRIVYFATHGLVSGEVQAFSKLKAEPALALTLPDHPTSLDDGLLTASEIAQLRLDADWAILSACNTAAEGKPGAEALSGLARAFFYAGARSLVVSHWRVEAGPAVRLMVGMIQSASKNPRLSHGEALSEATLAMLDNATGEELHPRMWAPFVVVGEPRKPR